MTNHTMTPTRKIITGIIAILAIVGCFVAFKKESASVIEKQSTEQTYPSDVKGASESVSTIPTTMMDYSTAQMAEHLKLTSANIIWFTNYEREQNNLPPLSESSKLDHSSADKLYDMFEYQYFDHTRPGTNQTFDVFFDKEGYGFIKIGENLAMGDFTTSKAVVDAWMNSPEHRRNILDTVYTNIGVSVEPGIMNGNETYMIVEHFGKPSSDCPSVDFNLERAITSLRSEISSTQSQIQNQEGEVAATNSISPSDNSVIDQYNELVSSYNSLITQMTSIAESYNKQVTNYDECIQGK